MLGYRRFQKMKKLKACHVCMSWNRYTQTPTNSILVNPIQAIS
jgi:hypothetical protein